MRPRRIAAGPAGPRRIAAAVLAAALALGGCGSNLYIGAEEDDPAVSDLACERPDEFPSGMIVLMAQSVPAASVVPCLRAGIGNWTLGEFGAEDGATVLQFRYQYGGNDLATVELRPACDTRDAREVSSQHPGTRRYNRDVTRGGRYANEVSFVFDGGCASLRFDLAANGAELRGAELAGALGFVRRADLDRQIRAASDGRLELDPA